MITYEEKLEYFEKEYADCPSALEFFKKILNEDTIKSKIENEFGN